MAERRHVLVTDAGRGSAVAFIRSLGRRGWRVTAADWDRGSRFRSRYTPIGSFTPRPRNGLTGRRSHPPAVESTGVDLVIPVTDEVGLPLADARSAFDGRTILALPASALAATHDKAATVALADRLGVPTPLTRSSAPGTTPSRRRARSVISRVINPSRRARSSMTHDRRVRGLLRRRRGALPPTAARQRGLPTVLLQRWLPGEGIGVELLMDHGRPIAAFQHRRLREVPPTGGASALRESVELDRVLYEGAVAMLRELAWTGLAMVEFRRGKMASAT